jgi:hypothetical protein
MTIHADSAKSQIAARAGAADGRSLRRLLGFLRLYFGSIATAARQVREVRRLEAMSDEDLRKAGLTRERILDDVMNGDDRRR